MRSPVLTLRSVARSSLSLALLSAMGDQLVLLTRNRPHARTLRGVRSTYQLIVGEVRALDTERHLMFLHIAQLLSKRAGR